ncbi:MAG: hypothetical protein KAQ67_12180 [Gammaproteobacteria bacterium]|nr:hypothetical protein [Gammaproteobacteria bacterium]
MLDSAQSALARLYTSLRGMDVSAGEYDSDSVSRFNEAMNEDFNTAEALAVLFDLANKINKYRESDSTQSVIYASTLKHLGAILGLLEDNPDEFLKSSAGTAVSDDNTVIDDLVAERVQAKKDKNWQRADEIRDQLHGMGVELEDNGLQTSWRRV